MCGLPCHRRRRSGSRGRVRFDSIDAFGPNPPRRNGPDSVGANACATVDQTVPRRSRDRTLAPRQGMAATARPGSPTMTIGGPDPSPHAPRQLFDRHLPNSWQVVYEPNSERKRFRWRQFNDEYRRRRVNDRIPPQHLPGRNPSCTDDRATRRAQCAVFSRSRRRHTPIMCGRKPTALHLVAAWLRVGTQCCSCWERRPGDGTFSTDPTLACRRSQHRSTPLSAPAQGEISSSPPSAAQEL